MERIRQQRNCQPEAPVVTICFFWGRKPQMATRAHFYECPGWHHLGADVREELSFWGCSEVGQ